MTRSLRPYLEYQADRVEAVLATHRAPGRITGGTVGPRLIRFFLSPAPHIRYTAVKNLADDLALAMQISTVSIDRGKEGIILAFPNPNPHSLSFPNLLAEVKPLPASTALLGLTDDGAPLLARLSAPEVAHILTSGTTGSGKSVLLRDIAASLALTHRPDVLRIVCIDPKNRTFTAFAGIAHLARPPITQMDDAVEALHSLAHVMVTRDARGERPGPGIPRIVVFIDELADLVMTGGNQVLDIINRIAQRGRESGIHLVAATQHPAASILTGLLKANFPLRLVGKVASANDARVASGRAGTNAHLLNGRGDFLAIASGDASIRFQVPFINESDLRDALKPLTQTPQPAVLPTVSPGEIATIIEVAPQPIRTGDINLAQDKAKLLDRARRKGRMPTSPSEAERWIFDKNRGGSFWRRTQLALAATYQEGFDVSKPPTTATTTTTKKGLPWIVSQIKALTG